MKTTTKYFLGIISLWLTVMLCAFTIAGDNNFDLARQEVMLRKIGHQILLHSGDSTSRVLPVKKLTENEYQITFENEFTFQPDSLVSIVKAALAQNKLSSNYIINVLNCSGSDIVFGYMISNDHKNDVAACSGRKQPKSCYRINLRFENSGINTIQKVSVFAGIPVVAIIGFLVFGLGSKSKKEDKASKVTDKQSIKIGNTLFYPEIRELRFEETITELTAKENKLLSILAASPNTVVERNRLQKEIWEDEGVIVGRSLDVFVSKLRKKLEMDDAIKLGNIHGRGYKLETTN